MHPQCLISWRVSKINAPTKSVLGMPDLPRSALFSTLWPYVIRPVSVLSIASLPFRGNEQISDWWDISPARRSTLYWLRQISRPEQFLTVLIRPVKSASLPERHDRHGP